MRRLHGRVDIGGTGLGDHCPGLAIGRIKTLKALAVLGIDPFAVDIHLVLFKFSHVAYPVPREN